LSEWKKGEPCSKKLHDVIIAGREIAGDCPLCPLCGDILK